MAEDIVLDIHIKKHTNCMRPIVLDITKKPLGYLNGLDGLRAMCAIILLWRHINQADFCIWGGQSLSSIRLPECCAYIFFVLSGFLAGYRSEGVLKSTGAYYGKRARKILPLYYGYIAVSVLAFALLGRADEVANAGLWYYLLLIPQVPFAASSINAVLPLVHLWFVGVIVLFYTLFPLFCGKKRLVAGITVGWALLKWGLYIVVGKDTFAYRFVSVTAFDCLFLGVWFGLLWRQGNVFLTGIAESRVMAVLAWGFFLLSGIYMKFIPSPARIEFMAGIGALLILNQISRQPVFSLENRVFRWLGAISYEIYVVQILVIMLLSMLYTNLGWHWPGLVIYGACTVVVVFVSEMIPRTRFLKNRR